MAIPFNTHDYVRSAQSGDSTAWNILFHYHYPSLFATALKVCKDIPLAKDAVQETFIKAHLKLKDLRNAAAFDGWIRTILLHHCYRAQHQMRNTYRLSLPVEADGWWEDELNEKLDKLYADIRLYAILSRLPDTLQTVLLLRYFSEFHSYEEIAGILSIPVGTVRSRLNQAKQKLAAQWEEQMETNQAFLRHSQEWNHFYHAHFSAAHYHDSYKNQLVDHLEKDVQLTVNSGKPNSGRLLFEKMIIDDRQAGSWLTPANVATSGNISIIESTHFNSVEHPDHCPSRSVLILHRQGGKVIRMYFHF